MNDAAVGKVSRRSWHRVATKPIQWWIFALLITVALHPFIPQFRWLAVHMVTLGLVTTSILVWGQHFTEALLKTRLAPESRPTQVRRIYALTISIVITMLGMVFALPWVTVLGSVGVSAVMLWYAFSLGQQIKAAIAPRFTFVVRTYLIAACLLPMGALLGAMLAFSPDEPLHGRTLLAHQLLNVLGFLGITATATLLTLWPTILRTKIDGAKAPRASASLILMVVGIALAALGALFNNVLVGLPGLALYFAGFVSIALILVQLTWHRVSFERGNQAESKSLAPSARFPLPEFALASISAGLGWFAVSVLALGAMWLGHSGLAPAWLATAVNAPQLPAGGLNSPFNFVLTASNMQALTIPFVVGFALQLLLGAMTFLMPTAMGGGPKALKASFAVMNRFGLLRVLILNLALIWFLSAELGNSLGDAIFGFFTLGIFAPAQFGSITRVLVSSLALLALASFVVLMFTMVRVNLRERLQQHSVLGMPSAALPTAPGSKMLPIAGPDESQKDNGPVAKSAGATGVAGSPGSPHASALDSKPVSAPSRRLLAQSIAAGTLLLAFSGLGRALDGTLAAQVNPTAGSGSGVVPSAEGSAAATVVPTGNTTHLRVRLTDAMRFEPASVDVPLGDVLVLTLENVDPVNVHDLTFENGLTSGRIQPGESVELEVGLVTSSLEGWCSIVGHKAMGMTFTVNAV